MRHVLLVRRAAAFRLAPLLALAVLLPLARCSYPPATGGKTSFGGYTVLYGDIDGRLAFVLFTDVPRGPREPRIGGKGGPGTPLVFGDIPLARRGTVEFLSRIGEIEIGSKTYDLSRGRVFLVTAGERTVEARQLGIEVDGNVPWSPGEILRLSQSPEVSAFVAGLPRIEGGEGGPRR